MEDRLFIFGPGVAKPYRDLGAQWVHSPEDALNAVAQEPPARRESMLREPRAAYGDAPIAPSPPAPARKAACRLLTLEPVAPPRLAALRHVFKSVIADAELLGLDELWEVLDAPDRRNLFVGGIPDEEDRALILYRGDFTSMLVPFDWFEPRPKAGAPDWAKFQVTDYGQTLRMGEYEAAADAILYEFDPLFRKEAKKRLFEADDSFGAALRRIRLQRGLRQSDFPPVSAKEVARIERGEVDSPRRSTLRVLAERLGAQPEEIASY